MRAKLIAFEGADCSGKSTQSKLLTEWLNERDLSAIRVKVPSTRHGITYALIYWMLRSGWALKVPNLFQFIHFINKFLFQTFSLPWLMRKYDVIIFDRWMLSAIIYGNATGVNKRFNEIINRRLIKPDVTVVLSTPPFHRKSRDNDSYENDYELQHKVHHDYRVWCSKHTNDHVLIDASGDLVDVQAAIINSPKLHAMFLGCFVFCVE